MLVFLVSVCFFVCFVRVCVCPARRCLVTTPLLRVGEVVGTASAPPRAAIARLARTSGWGSSSAGWPGRTWRTQIPAASIVSRSHAREVRAMLVSVNSKAYSQCCQLQNPRPVQRQGRVGGAREHC